MAVFVQVREERATDKEIVETERLANVAVLALATSQVVGGGSDAAVRSVRSMYAAPSYIPAVPVGTGQGPGTPHNVSSIPDALPRSFSLPAFAPKPKEDVFGPAFPGLCVGGGLLLVHSKYSEVRDSLLQAQASRTAADACAAVGVLATLLMTHVV